MSVDFECGTNIELFFIFSHVLNLRSSASMIVCLFLKISYRRRKCIIMGFKLLLHVARRPNDPI
jgi:hypothetical protein